MVSPASALHAAATHLPGRLTTSLPACDVFVEAQHGSPEGAGGCSSLGHWHLLALLLGALAQLALAQLGLALPSSCCSPSFMPRCLVLRDVVPANNLAKRLLLMAGCPCRQLRDHCPGPLCLVCWQHDQHQADLKRGVPAGNMVFMPRGSVVIDVVPANNADKAPWVMFMGADYRPLHILPITLPQQKTVLMMHKVRRSKEWTMMTPYWRQRLLREGVCPEVSLGWRLVAGDWEGWWQMTMQSLLPGDE